MQLSLEAVMQRRSLLGQPSRIAKHKAFKTSRRGKRSAASRAKKTVSEAEGGFFGTLTKAVKSGTQVLRLPGNGGKQAEGGTMSIRRRQKGRGPDASVIFVAGATGRLGARIVRELLSQGYRVRAGVRSIDKAENFVRTAANYGVLSGEELSRLDVVQFDLEDPDTLLPALGNAGKVVCAIGAAESEISNFSAPRRIDGEGATALVEAATKAGVQQFVMVTSLGTGKFGFPAGILNVFGGVLIWKRRAEEALERSGMPYVIVRPGGMERPRDDYKLTHNARLATRDKLFGGQVSRLQVAELVTACVTNEDASANKVLEVVAEVAAPALSWEDLLLAIPQEEDPEAREERRQRRVELQGELEEARGKLAEVEGRLAALKANAGDVNAEAAELKKKEAMVKKEQQDILKQAQGAEAQLTKVQQEADLQARLAAAAKAVLSAAQQAQREGRQLSPKEISEIRNEVMNPPQPKEESATQAPASGPLGSLFGGKRAAAAKPEEEAEEEEQPAPAASTKKGTGLAGFFTTKKQKEEEEAQAAAAAAAAAAQEQQAEEEAPARKQPAGLVGMFERMMPGKPGKEEKEGMKIEEEVSKVAEEEGEKQEGKAPPKQPPQRVGTFERLMPGKPGKEEKKGLSIEEEVSKVAEDESEKQEKKGPSAQAQAPSAQKAGGLFGRKSSVKEQPAQQAQQQAEAKAKAEAEAKAKAEAEAKAKAEAEAKAKAEAEAKAKAEAEAKAKAEAEAKAKAEAEAKAKAEEEAKAKAEEEAKAKVEAEAAKLADERKLADEQAAKSAAEAKAWIQAWRERSAVAAAEAAKKPAPAQGEGQANVAANAAEARAWIQSWREGQAGSGGNAASASNGAGAATQQQQQDGGEGAANPFGGLLRLFGVTPQAQAEGPAAAEAAVAASAVAKPAEVATASAASAVASNTQEAREWIAAWKVKQASAAGSDNGSTPAAAPSGDAAAAANVAEARRWIEAWKAKQAK